MKTFLTYFIIFILSISVNYAQSKALKAKSSKRTYHEVDTNNPRTWRHFRIQARIDDDSVFSKIQDEIGIHPKVDSYTLDVNIKSINLLDQYIAFTKPLAFKPITFPWYMLSDFVQKRLLKWTGTNKENLNSSSHFMEIIFYDKAEPAIISVK